MLREGAHCGRVGSHTEGGQTPGMAFLKGVRLELSFGQEVLVLQAKLNTGVAGRENNKRINMEKWEASPLGGWCTYRYCLFLSFLSFFSSFSFFSGVLVSRLCGMNKKAGFVLFASFRGVNIPSMTDSKLLTWC